MHNTSPIQLKTSTPIWNAKDGLFAVIDAVGFTFLTFQSEFYPVVAALEYQQSSFGNQTLKINGESVPVNPVANSITNIALIWKTWGEENLIILTGDQAGTPVVNLNVDKIPVTVAYAETLTVAYNAGKPNINITGVSGVMDLNLTGTSLGASGLITLQLVNELAIIIFVTGKAEGNHNYTVGNGEEILLAYIHTNSGLKFYCANPNPVI